MKEIVEKYLFSTRYIIIVYVYVFQPYFLKFQVLHFTILSVYFIPPSNSINHRAQNVRNWKNVEREGVRELSLQSYANLFWKTSSAPSPKLHPTNLNFGYSYFWLIRGLLDPYVYQCVQLGPSLFSIRISNLAMHICCQPTFHSSTL